MLVQDISSKMTPMGERDYPTRRIWRLQYGPCWCRGVPGQKEAFDLMRMGPPETIPGPFGSNLLLISERILNGSRPAVRDLYERVPEPRIVISLATCPATGEFWDSLPGGWSLLSEIVDVDLRIRECASGNPEVLLAAVLGQVTNPRILGDGSAMRQSVVAGPGISR